jgi:hypothetical protein
VNSTVATPLPFVRLVDVANVPPLVLDHVTTWPPCDTALPPTSASCAVIVTFVPTVGETLLVDTTYRVGVGPPPPPLGVVVIVGALPVSAPVVAVTT